MNQMLWSNLKRTWTYHFSSQITTLIVLVASYAIICAFLTLGQNLRSVLSMWGESIQMTVFLKENVSPEKLENLKARLQAVGEVADIRYVSKQEAAEKFKMDMSGFMPEVFQDEEFIAPFPSSFIISFKDQIKQKINTKRLSEIAKQVSEFEGAEDIAYGQDWLNNYASFISGINNMGWALIIVLLSGSIFVVGTSIKTSIFSRRDEIEIMELVGATNAMIRLPLVVEGMFLGLVSSIFAVVLTYFAFLFVKESMVTQAFFLTIQDQFHFLSGLSLFLFISTGTISGGLSALFFARKLNHGWLASQRSEV